MKKARLVGVVAIAVTLVSCVTSPPIPPEERIIEGVFEVDKTKDELHEAAMVWMVKAVENSGGAVSTFSWFDSEAAIEYEGKEAGRIMGKIEMKVIYRFFGTCPTRFMLTVEVQDGKARATAEDAYYVYRKRYQKPYGTAKWWGGRMTSKEDHYRQIDRFIDNENLMSSYKPEVFKLFEDLKASLIEEEAQLSFHLAYGRTCTLSPAISGRWALKQWIGISSHSSYLY